MHKTNRAAAGSQVMQQGTETINDNWKRWSASVAGWRLPDGRARLPERRKNDQRF